MYSIYKITNKVNGKIYVGQTNNWAKRYRHYKSIPFNTNDKDYNRPIHLAIRKYGLDNFSFEIIEELPEESSQILIDEREAYYIQFFNCLTGQGRGYNVALGGQGSKRSPLTFDELFEKGATKKFSKEEIIDIQQRLIHDEEFEDIQKIYSPRLGRSLIQNINCGENYYNSKLSYPLKKHSKSRFTQAQIREIKGKIKSGIVYKKICDEFGISSPGFISMINTGKYFHDDNETYPLCAKGSNRAVNKPIVEAIIRDLILTKDNYSVIGERHGRCESTVRNINNGTQNKDSRYIYPIRANKEINKAI